jgi:hypothetical protein
MKCKARTVVQNDTCESIADANGLTWTQVMTWNPAFGADCKRIGDYVGFTMCVSTPGGDYVNPNPVPTTLTSTFQLPSFVGIDVSLLPTPTNVGAMNESDIWTYQFAKGTRMDCAVYANGTDFGSSMSCDSAAAKFGTTTADLVIWNPSLSSGCTLDGSLTYCVQQVTVRSHSITEYCTMDDMPTPGTNCTEFLDFWHLDYETFEAFNPGVGSKCENFAFGRED